MSDEIGKIKWQCRRGSKELDLLLQDYLEQCYPLADAEEKNRFVVMLKLDDAQLMALLLAAKRNQQS